MSEIAAYTCFGINVVPALVLMLLGTSVVLMIWGDVLRARQSRKYSQPVRPPLPYPHTTLMEAACRFEGGAPVSPCSRCQRAPSLGRCKRGYYLMCPKCRGGGELRKFAKQAAAAWNITQEACDNKQGPLKMNAPPWSPPRPRPTPTPRSTSKLPLGVKPTRPPPPVPPYPHSTLILADCANASSLEAGGQVLPCGECRRLPDIWHCSGGSRVGFYLRCGKCGETGQICESEKQVACAWNAIQSPKRTLANPFSAKAQQELCDMMGRINWGPGLPSKGDTVVFPAAKAGRTITSMHIEGGTVEVRDYPKVDFKLLGVFAGKDDLINAITQPPREVGGDKPLHLWRRLCKWMTRPSRKPFLRPSQETTAQFEVWLFKKGLA